MIETPSEGYRDGGFLQKGGEKKPTVARTGPEYETYGPITRIDGVDYQASKKTGNTLIPMFADGTQMPILLDEAEVVAKKDRQGLESVQDVLERTNSGVVGDYSKTDKVVRDKFEEGVRSDINQAGQNMMNVTSDLMSMPGRATTGAFLNLATGKKINTNSFPITDAARVYLKTTTHRLQH